MENTLGITLKYGDVTPLPPFHEAFTMLPFIVDDSFQALFFSSIEVTTPEAPAEVQLPSGSYRTPSDVFCT